MSKRLALRLSLGLLVLALAAPFLAAQEPYKIPPKNVIDILNAPPTPRVSMSPDRDVMLLVESESMPTIAYISQPLLRIAGMRITPANNSGQVLSLQHGPDPEDDQGRPGAQDRPARPGSSSPAPPGRTTASGSPSPATSTTASSSGSSTSRRARPRP